jgi:hypothetical protein
MDTQYNGGGLSLGHFKLTGYTPESIKTTDWVVEKLTWMLTLKEVNQYGGSAINAHSVSADIAEWLYTLSKKYIITWDWSGSAGAKMWLRHIYDHMDVFWIEY